MVTLETDVKLDHSVPLPCKATPAPVESIALTMKDLNEAASQMRLAVTEALSVTMFCGEVKRSLSSLIGAELHEPRRAAEPVLDQLYQDAHRNLSAIRRFGRQTVAATNAIERAASTLYRLAVQLDAQQLQAAASAACNNEMAPLRAGRPEEGCVVQWGREERTPPHQDR